MRKKPVDQSVIILLILTLVTLASWVGFEVYRAYRSAKTDQIPPSYLLRLDPTLNTKVLEKIEKRIL